MVTSVGYSSIPYYVHAWLYKGCGYYADLSVPCSRYTVCSTRKSRMVQFIDICDEVHEEFRNQLTDKRYIAICLSSRKLFTEDSNKK